VPASALTEIGGKPAVWIFDRANKTVNLRQIAVARFDPDSVVVARGLRDGDIVVTAGVQALHPGQKVRLLSEAAGAKP
jgi:multidrug efflux pump subunit AcrA (membrane-fusion protein)